VILEIPAQGAILPRIDRILAHNLGLPRRLATRLFRQRRVARAPALGEQGEQGEQGALLTDPTLRIPPQGLPLDVLVDGDRHTLYHRYHVLQHKPIGVITALKDGRHATARGLLGDELPLAGDLRAVGRLDLDASGLLLWTTDGALLHRLTHPRYAVPRVYQVALAAPFRPPAALDEIVLEDGYRPQVHHLAAIDRGRCHPGLVVPSDAAAFATITLTTGQFHEVKRIFALLGAPVLGLCRVAYGPVELPHDLPAGAHRGVDLTPIFAGLHPQHGEPEPDDDADDDDDED
jgi:16S rRNA pseudouridine516 synthase